MASNYIHYHKIAFIDRDNYIFTAAPKSPIYHSNGYGRLIRAAARVAVLIRAK